MSKSPRVALAAFAIAFTAFCAAGCSDVAQVLIPQPSAEPTSDAQEMNELALARYVEAERATIPHWLEQYPGVYSEARVEGFVDEQYGDKGIPAGLYSVVEFTYSYANVVDWPRVQDELDLQRPLIDELCRSTIFPAMRAAGITGPMGVVYRYNDPSAYGIIWSYSCSDY